MSNYVVKKLTEPDEVMRAPGVTAALVNIGGMTLSRDVHEPGWRWSTHVKPLVGTESCQVRHLGVVLSGHLRVVLDTGEEFDVHPWEVMDIPIGHDAWVVGDEPLDTLGWRGSRTWLEPLSTMTERVLSTILFTDIVDSTGLAVRIGDRAWGDLLSSHDQIVREVVLRFRGRLVKLTGDGALVTFDSPGRALRAAMALRADLATAGLQIRGALHTGEIEIAGDDIRGRAVHEAARMLGVAEPGQVILAEGTRSFTLDAGVDVVDLGERDLRGLEGRYQLYAVGPS
jgi:class 3 adenylate cyclase